MNVKIVSAGWALLFVAPLLFGQFGRRSLPGNPLAGITAEEFERFRLGLEDFVEVEDADEGLGPAFNGLGCSQCHNSPALTIFTFIHYYTVLRNRSSIIEAHNSLNLGIGWWF